MKAREYTLLQQSSCKLKTKLQLLSWRSLSDTIILWKGKDLTLTKYISGILADFSAKKFNW